MDITTIRKIVDAGDFTIVDHALTEAFKDGISITDIIFCIKRGKIIETYPDRKRCLIFFKLKLDIPLHVVVDYSSEEIDITTVYIPDPQLWINFQIRKRGK